MTLKSVQSPNPAPRPFISGETIRETDSPGGGPVKAPPSISRDDLLALGAEAVDGKGDHVAGVEIDRRLAAAAVIMRMPRAGS